MKRWTVIVPLKSEVDRKSRLACHLTYRARRELTDSMLGQVVAAVPGCRSVQRIVVLSPEAPSRWTGAMLIDRCRGLNQELAEAAVRLDEHNIAIIHADLPQLCAEDVAGLLAAADAQGSAIAPDRHGTGTNALALQSTASFRFCFGPDSFALHTGQLPGAHVVDCPGFSFDLDTVEDLDHAVETGLILDLKRFEHA